MACRQLTQQIAVNYTVEDYTITDTTEIPAIYKTIVLLNPADSFPATHFKKIDNYLNAGGSILVAYNGLFGSLSTPVVQTLPDNGVRA